MHFFLLLLLLQSPCSVKPTINPSSPSSASSSSNIHPHDLGLDSWTLSPPRIEEEIIDDTDVFAPTPEFEYALAEMTGRINRTRYKRPNWHDRDELYALSTHAFKGDAPDKRPWNPFKKRRWQAWFRKKGVTRLGFISYFQANGDGKVRRFSERTGEELRVKMNSIKTRIEQHFKDFTLKDIY
jgi:acyl-CoA-binding protein